MNPEPHKLLIDIIQKRLTDRNLSLLSIADSPMDEITHDEKRQREMDSRLIKEVMREQKDLLDIISLINWHPIKEPKGAKPVNNLKKAVKKSTKKPDAKK